jgi:regulator of cell morphogenesis and NO signaling
MNLNLNKTVRDLAVELPGATRVFERLGIDYCCDANQQLNDACAEAGITTQEVIDLIENQSQSATEEPNFRNTTATELIKYIVDKHHSFTKTELERLRLLIDKVCEVHGKNHAALSRVRSVFKTLSAELKPHMMKEECVLFPYIIKLEEAEKNNHPVSTPPFRTVAHPVAMMNVEHEGAGYLLKQMRQITSNYSVPADACTSYQTLYQALEAFEKDLHQHVHLESNILFPRALEMEMEVVVG